MHQPFLANLLNILGIIHPQISHFFSNFVSLNVPLTRTFRFDSLFSVSLNVSLNVSLTFKIIFLGSFLNVVNAAKFKEHFKAV